MTWVSRWAPRALLAVAIAVGASGAVLISAWTPLSILAGVALLAASAAGSAEALSHMHAGGGEPGD